MQDFPQLLRQWRAERRFSQLALASEAGVSARHVSFLESGRSKPSRHMVIHLAEVLDVPRTERNAMLDAAGFSAAYKSRPLDDQAMAPVRAALDRVMTRHMPYPALLMDRHWVLKDLNPTAEFLFGMSGMGKGDSALSVLDLPGGPETHIENWGEVGTHILARLKAESRVLGGDAVLDRAAARIAKDPHVQSFEVEGALPPVVHTVYRAGDMRLAMFSSFMQLGGAEDIALTELRVEMMFPADTASAALLEELARRIAS